MRAFILFLAMLAGLISDGPLATSPSAAARGGITTVTVVSGTVTDAASGAPLMGAQITSRASRSARWPGTMGVINSRFRPQPGQRS